MALANDLVEWITMDPTRTDRTHKLVGIHHLRAIIAERQRGQITLQEAQDTLLALAQRRGYAGQTLPAAVSTQVAALISAINSALLSEQELFDVLALNEVGSIYITGAAVGTRLGL